MSDPSAESAIIVETTPDHAVGYWERVVFYVWRGTTTEVGVEAVRRATQALKDAASTSLRGMGVVEPGASFPPREVRNRIAAVMREEWGGSVDRSALIFEGTGLQAAAVRSVATSLALLARQPFPHRVFASASAAAAWLYQDKGEEDRQRLLAALRGLRAG